MASPQPRRTVLPIGPRHRRPSSGTMQRVPLVRSVAAVGAVIALAGACGSDSGDTLRTPWEATSTEDHKVALRVFTGSMDCGELGRIETAESGETVEIRAYIHEIG